MRTVSAGMVALAAMLPGVADASDYLYTFMGTVSDAFGDYPFIAGDPISISLRVRDSFHQISYVYLPTGSSAVGGPDYTAGTTFPVDRTLSTSGYSEFLTPLEDGYRTDDDYSASVSKDLAAKSLTLGFHFESVYPESPYCTDHCYGDAYLNYYSDVRVYSDAFTSPDFREVGSFDLTPGSAAYVAGSYSGYTGFGESADIALSHLTVERLPAAVPEPTSWAMMIVGLGGVGGAVRRRNTVRATVTFA